MTEMKIDSREFMSDADAKPLWEGANKHWALDDLDKRALRVVLDEALRRAARAWGVTGRRVEGCVDLPLPSGNIPFARPHTKGCSGAPATLYISDPTPPKLSAEERIEKAITASKNHLPCNMVDEMTRILRGEVD